MTTNQLYFAFIRAINTGGRRLTNDQIVEPFWRLGFAEVVAYQAAGNVAFQSDDPTESHPERLDAALAEAYGFDAPTFVRRVDEVRAIVDGQPFTPDELAATAGKIQVSFLRSAPDATRTSQVQALVPQDDRVVFSGREWFWLPTDGVSGSQLNVGAIEQRVGLMTMRTLGTVSRMLNKFTR